MSRRARIDRFIVSLTPMFKVIAIKMNKLNLGEPRLMIGPTLLPRESPIGPERIRRGAVWYLKGNVQCGFHVDFAAAGLHIEAWTGQDRRVSVWIAGEYSQASLGKDLGLALAASGLTDLAASSALRTIVNGR